MALFVRDMCTTAVLGHGNFPVAIFVHTTLPVPRTCILMHCVGRFINKIQCIASSHNAKIKNYDFHYDLHPSQCALQSDHNANYGHNLLQ